MAGSNQMPVLVKVISVLYYIGAVLSAIFGILMLIGAGILDLSSLIPFLGAGLFIVGAIIFIALAVLGFFVGRGLWNGKNWARIVAIVLAVLGVINAIYSIATGMGGIISLILHALIGGYLWFSKDVKQVFA